MPEGLEKDALQAELAADEARVAALEKKEAVKAQAALEETRAAVDAMPKNIETAKAALEEEERRVARLDSRAKLTAAGGEGSMGQVGL